MAGQAIVNDGTVDDGDRVNVLAGDARDSADTVPRRPPLWLVAGGVLAVLAVLLAGGLALDRHFRPRVGVDAVASPAAPARSTGPAGIALVNKNVDVQFTSALPTTSPEREIAQAYIRSWQVYAEAMYTGDTSKLPEVAAKDFLQLAIDDVEQRKARGRATAIQVKLNFYAFDVTNQTASVYDEYLNSSYAIDAQSKEPIGAPGQTERITDVYFLEKLDGVWKVVDGARQSKEPSG